MSNEIRGTYEVTLDGKTSTVTVTRLSCPRPGCDAYSLSIDGAEPVLVETTRPEAGILSLLLGHRTYECGIDHSDDGVDVEVLGRHHEAVVVDPKRKALRMAGSAGGAVIKTAMPGRIVRHLVAVGDSVAKGEPLMVVEAMKMENEIKAPRDGVVKRFAAA